MKTVLTNIIFLLLSFSLIGQQYNEHGDVFQDVVYLKDGSLFRGKLIDYKPGESLIIETWSGQQIKFDGKDVKKVRQEFIQSKRGNSERPYNFREKGYYNSTDVSLNWAENDWGGLTVGASIANVTGYQFNRFVGTGVGVGYDTYELIGNKQFIPIFAEVRGYLLKKRTTPMYRYQIGYGIGLKDLDQNLFKSVGGLYSYPAIGIRFGAKSGGNTTLDLGWKMQMAKQHYRIWEGTEIHKIIYQRFTLRCGIQF